MVIGIFSFTQKWWQISFKLQRERNHTCWNIFLETLQLTLAASLKPSEPQVASKPFSHPYFWPVPYFNLTSKDGIIYLINGNHDKHRQKWWAKITSLSNHSFLCFLILMGFCFFRVAIPTLSFPEYATRAGVTLSPASFAIISVLPALDE